MWFFISSIALRGMPLGLMDALKSMTWSGENPLFRARS
jgi:hypothetical protein